MAGFARNRWYISAYSHEVGDDLLARTVCGEPLVIYRTRAGEAVALADRCVHRRYPLSESHRDGDTIICGYHGFQYDQTGQCILVPGQDRIPRTARVPLYPTVEQDDLLWIWIGESGAADKATIPRVPFMADPSFRTLKGVAVLEARWNLLVDNLMDLSHEAFLHGDQIGSVEVAHVANVTEVDDENDVIRVIRRMPDAECPPLYERTTGLSGRITRWQDIEYFAPAAYLLHNRVAPLGSVPPEDGPDTEGFQLKILHGVTPRTEDSVYDFWSMSRNWALDDDDMSERMFAGGAAVIEQDVVALKMLEKIIATEPPGYQELSVNLDTGGLAARRLIARMVGESAASVASR